MSMCKDSGNNYKKLAQFEAAMRVDLSYRPKFFDNLLSLNEDFDINYRIPKTCFIKSERSDLIGTTSLNFMLSMLQSEIFKILLNRGADFTNLSHNGETVIHEAVGDDYRKQLSSLKSDRLIDNSGYAKVLLSAHVNHDISKNPCSSDGVSHFHIASMTNHKEAVEYFLKNEVKVDEAVDKDSLQLPGFTALHFAAMFASYETAEILLNHCANMHLKDARGMSALHVLVEERLRTFPSVFRMDQCNKWSEKNTKIYFDRNENMLKLFLKNISNNMDDIGLSNLNVACTLRDTSAVKQLLSECNVDFNVQINSDSVIRPGYTALHFAAAFSDEETFMFLLEKGAKMEIKDVHGICPFDLCLLSFKVSSIHSILSLHPTWNTIVFSDGKTKLLDVIRAMQTSEEFQLFLSENVKDINMFVPLDSPICAGYTPLHLSVVCTEELPNYNELDSDGNLINDLVYYGHNKSSLYAERIKKCLNRNANVCTQDTRGSSPLHWAFVLQETFVVDLLLGHHKQYNNPTNADGLSHLHIASALGNELVILKLLLNNRADLNSRSKINYFLHYDYKTFVFRSGSSPLHFAVVAKSLIATEILLESSADVLAVDHDNFNPLERLLGARLAVGAQWFYQEPYEETKRSILMMLIGRLSRVLVDLANASEILLCCYKLLLPKTLMLILESEDKLRDEILSRVGLTKLHVACLTNNINAVRELLKVEDVNIDAQVDEKSPIWSEMTPLRCYLDGRRLRKDTGLDFSIAKMLLEHGADVTRIRSGSSVVHEAFEIHCNQQMPFEVEVPRQDCRKVLGLIKLLLSYQRDFSVNPTATSGLSHFHISCACNYHEMAMEFLKNGADVNQKIDYFCQEYGGDTPLHIAVIYESNETVDVLLKHGADVHSTNSYNGTPLHVAAKTCFENLYIMEALLRAGADINAENIIGATPVELLMDYRSITMEEINICLKNGFRIDVINPVTKQGCLGRALKKQQNSEFVYKTFVESTDLTRFDGSNRNAIHNVVSVTRPSEYEIVEHDSVDGAFIPIDDYTKAIEELIKFNLNIDQQDTQGKTPLHYAACMQNVTAILGLLNNGADINISDEGGKTAFMYRIEHDEYILDNDYKAVDTRILQIFTSHAYKLASLDLDLDASMKKLLQQQMEKQREILRSTAKKCKKELAKLRVERIKSCSLTLDDFLSETSAIVNFSRLPLEDRHAVKEFFTQKTDYLREKYPEFAGILILQYRKALKRIKIIPVALESVSVLVGFSMPYICSDIILQYLSNSNLKNLIEAACW